MIEYYPNTYNEFECPKCKSNTQLKSTTFTGMRILADIWCDKCKEEYWADFPIGQGLSTPFYYSKKTHVIYPENKTNWYSNLLIDTIKSKKQNSNNIKFKFLKKKRKMIKRFY